jgi:hypothetical protein
MCTDGSESKSATTQSESAIQLTTTARNGLLDIILSVQPIMHRQPVTVKQIVAGPNPMPHRFLIDSISLSF